MSDQKYIILDRDGVINVDLFDYVTKPADFKFEDGSLEALSILSDNNFKIIVATNQACISLGIASKDQIDNVNSHMKQKVREHGSDIIHVEVCPHRPEDDCECRKPKTGLLLQAEKALVLILKVVILLEINFLMFNVLSLMNANHCWLKLVMERSR